MLLSLLLLIKLLATFRYHLVDATAQETSLVFMLRYAAFSSTPFGTSSYVNISLSFCKVKPTLSQFTKTIRKRNHVRKAGTEKCDRTWEHVKKSIPKSVNTRSCNGYLNTTNMLSYVYAWFWRRRCRQTLWKGLDLCNKYGKSKV